MILPNCSQKKEQIHNTTRNRKCAPFSTSLTTFGSYNCYLLLLACLIHDAKSAIIVIILCPFEVNPFSLSFEHYLSNLLGLTL